MSYEQERARLTDEFESVVGEIRKAFNVKTPDKAAKAAKDAEQAKADKTATDDEAKSKKASA